jgi:peptidyl-prolyl cis-trans isomerase SurA
MSLAGAATMDRVAAVVNDDLIVLSSVYDVGAEYLTAQIGTENLRAAELEVLNTLIQRTLVSQELQSLGMDVTDEEVEGAMNDIAESNGIARSELQSEVEASGLEWAAYQGEIRESLRQMKFNQLILQPRIVVEEQEILEQYRQLKLQQPDVIELHGIFLKNPPQMRSAEEVAQSLGVSLEEAQAKLDAMQATALADRNATLEQITALLNQGVNFIEIAKQYDQSGLAQSGGKMGTFAKGQLRPDLEKIAFSLEVGGVSSPFELESGVYILHVKALRKQDAPPLESIRPQLMDAYYAGRFEEEMATWFEAAKSRAAITIHLDTQSPE